MKLVNNWKRVVVLSLSFWMSVFGLAVLIYPEAKFYLTGVDTDPHLLWWIGVLLLLASMAGRLYEQGHSKLVEWVRISAIIAIVFVLSLLASTAQAMGTVPAADGKATVAVESANEKAALDMAVPFISQKEGIRLKAYLDIVGVPTICGGITTAAGIKVYIGMPDMPLAECMRLMRIKVAEYRSGFIKYLNRETLATRYPPARDTAYTSLAFNVGIATAGKSTATQRLNKGDVAGGCEALTWFNKAGGRVIRGLVARRTEEKALCMRGVPA
jgi:lysozyme